MEIKGEDKEESVKRYRLAAEQGDVGAQKKLAEYYKELANTYYSNGGKAAKWCQLAAEKGDVNARFFLGEMYYRGEGILKDYIQAYMWWDLAASEGNVNATNKLNIVSKKMTPDQKEKAIELVLKTKRKENSWIDY